MITSSAERPVSSILSTGIPRPRSRTVTELSGWIVTSIDSLWPGQRLVDGVRNDLLDEVVEAPRTGRADVHAGPEPDGLQPLEHGDVLGRVSGLRFRVRHNQEKPAKPRFCEAPKVYQTGRSRRSLREAQSDRFLHTFAQLFVADRGGQRAGPFLLLRGGLERRLGRLFVGLRERSRSEPKPRHAEALRDLPGLLPELERPHRIGRVHVDGAVLRDPRRPGVSRDRLAHRRGPALEQLGHARLRAEARELVADVVTERVQVPPPRPAPPRGGAPTRASR